MGAGWRTFANFSATTPPTRTVGLLGSWSSGCSASRAFELVEERVELGVADGGVVQDVVAVLVVADGHAEAVDAGG